jgi:hypothetical protein
LPNQPRAFGARGYGARQQPDHAWRDRRVGSDKTPPYLPPSDADWPFDTDVAEPSHRFSLGAATEQREAAVS